MKQGRYLESGEQNGKQYGLTEDSDTMPTGSGIALVGQTEVAHARYTAKLHPQGHHPPATGLPPPPSRGADVASQGLSTASFITPLSSKPRSHIPPNAPATARASQHGSEVAANQGQLSPLRDRPLTPPSSQRPFSRQALLPSRLGSPMPRMPRTPLHHHHHHQLRQLHQLHHTLPRGAAQYTADGLFGAPTGMQAPKPPSLYLARPGSKSGRATPPAPSLSSTLSNPLLSPRSSINPEAGIYPVAQQRPVQPLSARRSKQVLGNSTAHLGQEQQQLQQQWPSRTPLAQRQQPPTAGQLQQQHRQHVPSRMGARTRQPPRTPQLRQPPPSHATPFAQPPPPPPPPRTPQVALPPPPLQQSPLSNMPSPPLHPWRQYNIGLPTPDVSTQASSIPSLGGSLATSEWATNRGSSAIGGPRPPLAGVRGSSGSELPIDHGPNAFENDGRPGTRGGGTMYDLEGRPLTRGGGRPPSRMQMSAAAAAAAASASTGLNTAVPGLSTAATNLNSPACAPAATADTFGDSTGPLTLPPRTYASVASVQRQQQQLGQSLSHPSQARGQHHRSSIPAPPSPSSPSRPCQNAKASQSEQQHMTHSNTHNSEAPVEPQAAAHHTMQAQQCQYEGPDVLNVEDFVDRLPSDDDEGQDAKEVALPYDLQHWMDTSNPSKATGLCTLKAGAT
ncbi:hypothetical protein DUNSADRAFT_7072 [Dunaliella salina]|uniref:Uncharacterized protein n=1 Tax=Dunaliella salina TaxID=3046 RepID=A0ABQ7H6M5_DUNSA|nr:hypothetical protein DUNSADRAFT_7072 [Dunaliella salina]|eukprot:KAF5842463.1 hypothetical protein DUNSADRAFT_7072 [Dunaliella salina]